MFGVTLESKNGDARTVSPELEKDSSREASLIPNCTTVYKLKRRRNVTAGMRHRTPRVVHRYTCKGMRKGIRQANGFMRSVAIT